MISKAEKPEKMLNQLIIDTLEYDALDYSDFRAALDAISLALTQHYPILSVYREK